MLMDDSAGAFFFFLAFFDLSDWLPFNRSDLSPFGAIVKSAFGWTAEKRTGTAWSAAVVHGEWTFRNFQKSPISHSRRVE